MFCLWCPLMVFVWCISIMFMIRFLMTMMWMIIYLFGWSSYICFLIMHLMLSVWYVLIVLVDDAVWLCALTMLSWCPLMVFVDDVFHDVVGFCFCIMFVWYVGWFCLIMFVDDVAVHVFWLWSLHLCLTCVDDVFW